MQAVDVEQHTVSPVNRLSVAEQARCSAATCTRLYELPGVGITPALGDASSFVRTDVGARVPICSEQLKPFPFEVLHVVQLEVADADVHRHRGHVRSREVDRARGEVVLAQPLLSQVIEAPL